MPAQKSEYLNIKSASKILGVSTKTLRRWESSGKLIPERTSGGHRRYKLVDIKKISEKKIRSRKIKINLAPEVQSALPNLNNNFVSDTADKYEGFTLNENVDSNISIDELETLYSPLHKDQKVIIGKFIFLSILLLLTVTLINIAPKSIRKIGSSQIQKIEGALTNSGVDSDSKDKQTKKGVLALSTTSLEDQVFSVFVNTNLAKDAEIGGILSVGGYQIIGNGTSTITLESGDLFVSEDAEIGNSLTVGNLFNLGGDAFSSLSGTGLQVTAGVLQTTIGETVESIEITDGTITEADLSATNTPSDNQVLTYDSSTGTFSWAADATGTSSLFTDNGSITSLTSTTDDLSLGGSTSSAPFFMDVSTGILNLTGDLSIGSIELSAVGTDNITSGSSLIGVYDELGNSNATTLQDVLDDLDSAIGAGSSKWSQGSDFVYLTSTGDNVIVGGTTDAGGKLSVVGDADQTQLLIQGFSTQTNYPILFEQSDGDDKFRVTNGGLVQSSDLSLGLDDNSATLSTIDTDEDLNIDPNGTGNIYLAGATSIAGDADEIQFLVQGSASQTANLATFEHSDGTDLINIDENGNVTTGYDQLDGTATTTTGSGSSSTALVVGTTTNYTAGNYVRLVRGSGSCSGTSGTCFGKISAVNSGTGTLTLNSAMTWGAGDAVTEWHVPELGGANTTIANNPNTNRFGLLYSLTGTVTGSGSTYYFDGTTYTADITGADSKDFVLRTGDTTTSGDSGDITIDVGAAAGTEGTINIGVTNAASITIGQAGTAVTISGDTIEDFTGNGLTLSSDVLTVLAAPSANGLSLTTSNGSGLEVLSTGIALLQGCGDNEILKWDEDTDVWSCASDAGASSAIINIEEDNSNVSSIADTIDFGIGFDVDAPSNEADITLDFTELTDLTWGGGAGFTWTFDAGATDPTIAFASDSITIGGAATLSATAVTALNCTDCINFDDLSDALTLDAATTITNSLAGDFSIDLSSTGDFIIKDNNTAFAQFLDTGVTQLGQTDYLTINTTGDIAFTDADGASTITGPAGGDLQIIASTNDLVLSGDSTASGSQIQFTNEAGDTAYGYFVTGSTNTGDFAVDTESLYVDASDGEVGIGTTTPGYLLDVWGTGRFYHSLAAGGTRYGSINELATEAANASAVSRMTGSYNYITHDGTGTLSLAEGEMNEVILNSGSITDTTYGERINIQVAGTQTGIYAQDVIFQQAGTTSEYYAFLSQWSGLTGTITNSYGLSLQAPSGSGTITNNYGLYIGDHSSEGSSNSYNLYSAGSTAKNYFAGTVGIGDATPDALLDITGGEGADGTLILASDESDETADTWTLTAAASDNDLTFTNGATEVVSLSSAGLLQIDGKLNLGTTSNDLLSAGDVGSTATTNLYWGDDLVCDVSATNCGWASSASSPFTATGGIIDKTTVTDRLRLLYGDAADTQFTIENTTNSTIPTVDAFAIDLTGNTTGIVTDGVDVAYLAGEFGNGTTNTNSLLHLNLDPVDTPSGDETFYAINIDGLAAGTSASEYAISVGTNWDSVLRVGGTEVINGSGQIVSSQINGTLFSTNTDTASLNTIIQGDTLLVQGDSNGIDVTHSGDTMTVAFDGTEVGAETWGVGSGFAWTFDAGATDPVLTFADNALTIGGAATITATDVTAFNCTDCINFDDLSDSLSLDANTDIALGALTLSTSGTGALDFNSTGQVSFAGNVDAENGLDVTGANLTIGGSYSWTTGGVITAATDETINGIDIATGAVSDVIDLALVLGATNDITIDATSTDNTGTTGIIDINLDSTSSQQGINLDIETITDAGADTLIGLDILSTQTSTDNDVMYGIRVQDLAGTPDAGNEYAIYQAGTAWDYGLYIEDAALFNTTLAVNGNTTLGNENTDTLTINAGISGTGISFADSTFGTCTALETVSGVLTCGSDAGAGAGESPFTSDGGIIDKTTVTDRLRLLYGDAADTQFTIENTTNSTIPTVDAFAIDLTGNTTGIVTDGVDVAYLAGEFGNGTTNTNSLLHLNLDPVDTPSGDEVFYAINIDGISASSAEESAIYLGGGWDNLLTFEGATDDTIETHLRVTDPTSSDKVITFPDDTGTVCLSSGNCAGGSGGSKWTDGGAITYLTATADNLAIGDTSSASEFYFDITNGGNLTLNSTGDTENILDINANSLTTGSGIDVSSTATGFNGELLVLNKTGASGSTAFTSDIANVTYSQTFNGGVGLDSTGNVFDISRAITLDNTGNTHTISGDVARIADTGTQTNGTLTHTGNVLELSQGYASASGAVIKISNSGTGADIALDNDETIDNSVDGTLALGATTVSLTGTTTLSGTSLTAFNGGATAIDFTEFDVSATTGSITINDGGDLGSINIESTILDINSLDFVGAGTFTSGTDSSLTFTPAGTGDVIITNDSDSILSLTGGSDGTDALVIDDGDLTITDGDFDILSGDFNVALDAGDGVNITKGAAPTVDVFTINGGTSATDGVNNLQLTLTADDASGNLIDLTPTFTDNDAGNSAETWNVIDIDALTVTQNDSGGAVTGIVRGLNIGALTESATGDDAITSNAIKIGTGWDSILDYNGTTVINGTGQLVAGQLTGTLFSTNTDTASLNTIIQGDTLLVQGDSNGIDVTHSGDTMTVAFDGTEVGAETWGVGSGFAWTFDAGATDPVLTFADNALTIGGAATITATDVTAFNCTDCLDFDDLSDTLSLDASTSIAFDAAEALTLNAASADSTTTTGIIDLDVDTVTSGNIGLNIDHIIRDSAGISAYGARINQTIDTDAAESSTGYGLYLAADNDDASSTIYGLFVDADADGGGTGTEYAAVFLDGFVGIGVTTPGAPLEISYDASGDKLILDSVSDNNASTISFHQNGTEMARIGTGSGSTDDNLRLSADATQQFYVSDTEKVFELTAGGNGTNSVRVGTASPTTSSSFNVVGMTANSDAVLVRFEHEASVTTDYLQIASNGVADGNIFAIDSAGEVGIGDSTPDATLDVDGFVNFDLTATGAVTFDAASTDNTGTTGIIDLDLDSTSSQQAINLDIETITDAGADTLIGLDILSTQTSTDDDVIYGIRVQELAGTPDAGNEYAIYQAGTAWDYGLYIEDAALFNTTLAVNGNTTIGDANTDTLTINAGISGTGITFSDVTFATCTALETVSGVLTCGSDAGGTVPDFDDIYAQSILNTNLTMEIDDATGLTYNMNTTGAFNIQDNGTTFFSFDDDSTLDITFPAAGNITIDAEATDNTGTAGIIDIDLDSTSSQQALNLDIETITDAATDTLIGLDVLATQTSTDDDVVYGVRVQDLAGTPDAGNEYGIYQAGTAWDYGLFVEDAAFFNTTSTFVGDTDFRANIADSTGNLSLNDDTDITGILTVSSILQAGSATATTYSRLGTGTTGHSLDAANDLLISDDLEVDGDTYLDGTLTLASTFNCTDCIDFDDLDDTLDLDANTNINLDDDVSQFGLTVTSDLAVAARTASALTISQSSDVTNDFDSTSAGLLAITNADTGSSAPLLYLDNDSTSGTGIMFGAGITTGTLIDLGTNIALTSGTAITLDYGPTNAAWTGRGIVANTAGTGSLGGANTTGDLFLATRDITNSGTSGTYTDSGSFIDLTRSFTQSGAGGTYSVTGDAISIIQNTTESAGTVTDTSNLLSLAQNCGAGADCTGAVIDITNAGTGEALLLTSSSTGVFLGLNSSGAVTTADGILIEADHASGVITDAIDASDAEIVNAINVGQNFILGDGIRQFSSSSTVWTFEDTSGNDLATLTDNSDTGDFVLSGDLTVSGGDIVSATTANLLNTTSTTINFGGATTGALNIADAAITGTIDIGGVTADGASTVNIATNSTSADALAFGNSNASTTFALTGGDDWSINAAGDFTGENVTLSTGTTTAIDLTRSEAGQWMAFNDGTDAWGLYNYAGSPENNITANTGALAMDTTNGTLYVKTDDSDATGWTNLATGGTSPFTDGTTITYMTDGAEDFSIGAGSETLVAPFSVDVSANLVRIGDGTSDANDPTLTFYASDATNSGSISFLDADEFNITGAGLNLDSYLDLDSTSATAFTLGDGTDNYFTFDGSTDASDTLFAFTGANSGTTSGSLATFLGDTITTGTGALFSFDGLTTGTGALFESVVTGTMSGDLLRLNVGSGTIVTGDIFSIDDNGSELFSVNQAGITSNLPQQFTATGDVAVAYDVVLTNQTAGTIESYGPLTIAAGEPFESNNLTLKTWGSGDIVIDNDGSTTAVITDTGDVILGGTDSTNLGGAGLLAYGAICADDSIDSADDCIDAARSAGTVYGIASDFTVDDIAENFPTADATIGTADIVALDYNQIPVGGDPEVYEEEFVKKATSNDRSKLLGAISEQPGVLLGGWGQNLDPRSVQEVKVALAGRIPVKVNSQNGTINPGDPITTSSVAGVGTKATSSGMIIGTALGAYNDSNPTNTGTVLVFVNPIWFEISPLASIDSNGSVILRNSDSQTNIELNDVGELAFKNESTGETNFKVDNVGNTYLGNLAENTEVTPELTGEVCYEQVTDGASVNYKLVKCDGTPADLAEWYPIISETDEIRNSKLEIPVAGDVVSIGNPIGTSNQFIVEKSGVEYDTKAIGVVSTKAHKIMGEDVLEWADSAVAVALAGRVPVKIDPASSAIEPGDRLTSSENKGFAKKAERSGYTIGSALEAWNPTNPTETILVFVENSVSLNENLADNETSNSNLSIKIDEIQSIVDLNSVNLESINSLLTDIQEDQKFITDTINFESTGTNDYLNADQLLVNNLFVTESITSTSLSVAESIVVGNSFVISSGDGINSIESVEAPLVIQGSASTPISIMAGKITIDTDGNIAVAGNLLVEGEIITDNISTSGITITKDVNDTTNTEDGEVLGSEETSDSIGTATLTSGETSVSITTTALSQNSLIYITPTSSTLNKVLYVKGKVLCDEQPSDIQDQTTESCTPSFVVGIDGILPNDVEFNWWIVDTN